MRQKVIADIVLNNGAIYTVNKNNQWVEAIVIKDGRIKAVGSAADIEGYIGDTTEVIDLNGKMVMPAFVDAHMHPAMSSVIYLYQISLYNLFTHEDYLEAIRVFVDNHPNMDVYSGGGYLRSRYDEIGPRKEDLDAIISDKPIGLKSTDGHSMWVNSKVLELANITKDTPDPEGGVIKKHPDTGEPAGLLQEAAMDLVSDLFPEPTKEEYKKSLLWFQKKFNAMGLTTCHDAMVTFNPNYYMAYEDLAREGLLTIRYRGSWIISPDMVGGGNDDGSTKPEMSVDEAIETGIRLSKEMQTPYWQVKSFKFFSDQVIEEETGYLKEAYSHRDDNWFGFKVWDTEFLKKIFKKIDAKKYHIHIHQIGDAAAGYALEALEYAREINGPRDSRHAFAHLHMIDPEDIDRMAALGMTAIIAPYWTIIDDYYWDLYLPYLGEERAYNRMYPAKSLFDKGINTAIHSDFFVTEPDYGWAFYSAITRTIPQKIMNSLFKENGSSMVRTTNPNAKLEYYNMGPLGPEKERLSLEEVIRASTINGAYADFMEDDLGTIEVGKLADLVVIDRNLFEADVEDIANFKVLMTFFEGRIVYSAEKN